MHLLPDEEKLYNWVSAYLQSDKLYALPQGQRTLITLVLRKLLASSSFAISGTLNSLIIRLEDLLKGIDGELNMDDYDTYDELSDEESDEDIITSDLKSDRDGVFKELTELRKYAELAKSIKSNSKGKNLLTALKQGFDKTESRRTQERWQIVRFKASGYEGCRCRGIS